MFEADKKKILLVVNFGGPRNLAEVGPFLQSLLTDEEVIRTPFPRWIQNPFFSRVARKRTPKIAEDYEKIGGGSPIYEDTEWFAKTVSDLLELPYLTFHRYLESTHSYFCEQLCNKNAEEIVVFPLFPQFSYATIGSIAKWFAVHLDPELVKKFRWIHSFPADLSYIQVLASHVKKFLQHKELEEKDVLLFCSAHGLPKKFVQKGDPYESECRLTFQALTEKFPQAQALLAYQSKFGRSEWLTPATDALCREASKINLLQGKKHVVFIPLSFVSDHIETLFEIEGYVSCLQEQGISAFRCPALGRDALWGEVGAKLIKTGPFVSNSSLIRR